MSPTRRQPFVERHPHLAPLVVLIRAAVGIWLVIAFGTAGYQVIEGWPILDCFYMTMITLTTIGFSEIYPLSSEGRMFTVLVIFLGFGMVGYSAITATRFVIEGELATLMKRRRDMKAIEDLEGHYVVCGFGRMGSFICREFHRRSIPFVVVEVDGVVQGRIRESKYLLSPGDATDEEVLRSAGIDKASGLVTVLESDAANLYTVLSGRQLNPSLEITARAGERSAQEKLKMVGADRVINPYVLGGMRLVVGVLKPDVLSFLDVVVNHRELEIEIEQVCVAAGSAYCGSSLSEAHVPGHPKIILLSIKKADGSLVFNPPPETRLEAGLTLITIGDQRAIGELRKRLE